MLEKQSKWQKEVQYTLSFHFYGGKHQDNHLDLFLDMTHDISSHNTKNDGIETAGSISQEKPLITYKAFIKDRSQRSKNDVWEMTLSESHRKVYMSHQGRVSKNRGKVRILRKGCLHLSNGFKKTTIKIKINHTGLSLDPPSL